MSLTIALQNAVSGLHYNQTALGVVSNNVTNANIDGYTRKNVETEARILNGAGAGVSITGVTRQVSQALLGDLRIQVSAVSMFGFKDNIFGRMQDMFGSLSTGGTVSALIDKLGASLEALATTPESADARIGAVNDAVNLVHLLNSMAANVQRMRLEADQQVGRSVTNVNNLLSEIGEFNRQIAQALGTGRDTAELEDQRDLSLRNLAKEIDYTSFVRSTGEVVILTGTGRTLLDGVVRPLSHDAATAMDPNLTLGNGIDGIDLGGDDITLEIAGGTLKGAIDMRDGVLADFAHQLDNLAAMLRDQINAVHNNGTGYPPAPALTGSRVFADSAADIFSGTGTVRIALVDASGNYAPGTPATNPDVLDLDLTALGAVTIDAVANAINTGTTNLTAQVVGGKLVLTATGGFRVALDDSGTAETTTGRGFSQYFGLNDLFVSAETYAEYRTQRQTNALATARSTGTLTVSFAGMAAAASVNYTPATTLATLATDLTAAIAAQGGNATAQVVADGDGVRLVLSDPDGDALHLVETGGGSLVRDLGLATSDNAISTSIAVRADIRANPALLSRARVQTAVPALGSSAVTPGDNRTALALAAKFQENIAFGAAGGLPLSSVTFSNFGANMVSLNSAQAQLNGNALAFREVMQTELANKVASISGVNVDEELANLTMFQNAYAASARVISVTAEMLETLVNLGR